MGIRELLPKKFDIETFNIANASKCELLLADWNRFTKYRDKLSEADKNEIDYMWEEFWARKNQKEPLSDYFIWLLLMGRGGGKRLSIYTEIPTPFGWKTMGDLRVGDVVFSGEGEPCNVTEVGDVEENPDLYKVIFDDGNFVLADAEHQWRALDFRARAALRRYENPRLGPKVVTTKQIQETLRYRNRDTNWAIPLIRPVKYPKRELPLHPYFLGVWLAQHNFSYNEIVILNRDVEIIQNIRKLGYIVEHLKDSTQGMHATYRVYLDGGKTLENELIKLGLVSGKRIPDEYLQASVKQRVQLLRGIMDVCGDFSMDNLCYVYLKQKVFAVDMHELITSLGFKARYSKKRGDTKLANSGYTSIYFTPYNFRIFSTPRKVARQRKHTVRPTQKYRYIVGVEKVEAIPARCISVDSVNSTYLCTRNFITTHNTRSGAEWIRKRVESGNSRRLAIVARSPADARDVMVKGPGGILAVSRPDFMPRYEPSNRRIIWPNGAEAIVFSSYEPDQLRGPQFDTAWCDELAAWKYLEETWNNLMMCLRVNDSGCTPKCVVTTTPRPLSIIKKMLEDETIPVSVGSTFDNQAFLADNYLKHMKDTYHGTRLGEQELYGKLLGDVEGALWTSQVIEQNRIDILSDNDAFPGNSIYEKKLNFIKDNIVRIVVSIDPQMVGGLNSSSRTMETTAGNCESGIIVAGIDSNGCGYLLEDLSRNCTPLDWAKTAVNAFHKYMADRIVAEANQGGDTIETTIRTIDENISFKKVFAKKGKYTRAEPISALYERGRIKHLGTLDEYARVESQLINWVPGDDSPDRLDALVWAFTELMLDGGPSYSAVIEHKKEDNYILRNPFQMFDSIDADLFGRKDDRFKKDLFGDDIFGGSRFSI